MRSNAKISLSIPTSDKPDRYFSFMVKQNNTKEPSEYPAPGKIFVMSDIEGNFGSFCKILIRQKIITKRLHWSFEDNHVVILGNCFDKGEEVNECLWLIYSLEEEAKKRGGYVHFVLGNQEISNINGEWRYVHPKYAEHIKSNRPHIAFFDGSNELQRWLCTKNIIEKIGETLFVHAGISFELLQLGFAVDQINTRARPYYTQSTELFKDTFLSLVFNSENSPFWYQGYYMGLTTEEIIDKILSYFGVKTIVTGHTLNDKITTYFNGKVINVNTNHALDNSEGLMINRKNFYRITQQGKRERVK